MQKGDIIKYKKLNEKKISKNLFKFASLLRIGLCNKNVSFKHSYYENNKKI